MPMYTIYSMMANLPPKQSAKHGSLDSWSDFSSLANLKWQKMPAKCVKKLPSALSNILEFELALAFVKAIQGLKDVKEYIVKLEVLASLY